MRPGQEVTVQVLYNGKPLTVPVYATYDSLSGEENAYAYYTEGRPDGTASVKIAGRAALPLAGCAVAEPVGQLARGVAVRLRTRWPAAVQPAAAAR